MAAAAHRCSPRRRTATPDRSAAGLLVGQVAGGIGMGASSTRRLANGKTNLPVERSQVVFGSMAHDRPYHHGDLRAALLQAAVGAIAEEGAAGMSLREVARRAGVSHTAAAYHFRDKRGLLTAVAADGYRMLADEMRASRAHHRS